MLFGFIGNYLSVFYLDHAVGAIGHGFIMSDENDRVAVFFV
jgi:hypothetical protein